MKVNNLDLEPFLVHVTEIYSRNVVVYAENPDMAKELAEELCEEGLLLIDFDDFVDRNVETLRKAKAIDLNIFQAYGPEESPETFNISLSGISCFNSSSLYLSNLQSFTTGSQSFYKSTSLSLSSKIS